MGVYVAVLDFLCCYQLGACYCNKGAIDKAEFLRQKFQDSHLGQCIAS